MVWKYESKWSRSWKNYVNIQSCFVRVVIIGGVSPSVVKLSLTLLYRIYNFERKHTSLHYVFIPVLQDDSSPSVGKFL